MTPNPIRLRIHVREAGHVLATVEFTAEPAATLASLAARVFADHGLNAAGRPWQFRAAGTVLDPNSTIGEVAGTADEFAFDLEILAAPPAPAQAPGAAKPAPPPAPAPARSAGGYAAPSGVAESRRSAESAAPADAEGVADDFEVSSENLSRARSESAKPAPPRAKKQALPEPEERERAFHKDEDDEDFEDDDEFEDAPDTVTRRATIRYYARMNPERMFPLLVVLSAEQIREVVKRAVKQAESAGFQVRTDSAVEVEPILPGCDCYPPRDTLPVANEAVTATFWVVPHVLGRVEGARVVVRQNGAVLANVPLDVRVSKQTLAVACGLLGLVAPYLSMGLKSLRLDPATQKEEGFALYKQVGFWLLDRLTPEMIGFGLLGLAAAFYLAMRPKQRDVFWDLDPKPARG